MTVIDLMPFAGTIGGGFFIGLLAGYAVKKAIKIAAHGSSSSSSGKGSSGKGVVMSVLVGKHVSLVSVNVLPAKQLRMANVSHFHQVKQLV